MTLDTSSLMLTATFSALSDPTRRKILERLSVGGATVSELAEPLDMSLPAVSKHLRVLESAGLLERRKEGRTHHIELNPKPMKQAQEWIEHYRCFWESGLDRLADYLEKEAGRESSRQEKQARKTNDTRNYDR